MVHDEAGRAAGRLAKSSQPGCLPTGAVSAEHPLQRAAGDEPLPPPVPQAGPALYEGSSVLSHQ